VEGLAMGATARAGTGGRALLWHQSSRRHRGKQAQMIDATTPRRHDATMQSCQLDGGALQEYFATPGSRCGCTIIAVGRGQPETRAPDSTQSAAQQRGWRLAVGVGSSRTRSNLLGRLG
jgi:hypothetical protein